MPPGWRLTWPRLRTCRSPSTSPLCWPGCSAPPRHTTWWPRRASGRSARGCRCATSCWRCLSSRAGWPRQVSPPSRSSRRWSRPATSALRTRSSPLPSRPMPRWTGSHRRRTAMDDAERTRRGMTVRREVLGDEHVDRAVATTTSFTEPFQDLITRYAWGEIWSRPGLSRAERSLVTLAVLAALQHENELAMHVKAALRNGLRPEQISEVLLQVAVYAGVPAANRAFAIAQRVLSEVGAGE